MNKLFYSLAVISIAWLVLANAVVGFICVSCAALHRLVSQTSPTRYDTQRTLSTLPACAHCLRLWFVKKPIAPI